MKNMKKKVIKHLKGDIKSFKSEAQEDRELIKDLKGKKAHKKHEAKESKSEERKEDKAEKKEHEVMEHGKKKKPVRKAKLKPMAVKPAKKRVSKPKGKIKKVMQEFSKHELHSGSKKGPLVTNPKQAIAISLSESRKAGEYVKPMKKKRKGK